MLGKRCRTIQRTASISQNMGPLYMHHHNYHQAHDLPASTAGRANPVAIGHPNPPAVNSQVPTIIPQIIGFNPLIRSDAAGGNEAQGCPQSATPMWAPASNSDSPVPPPNNMSARLHPHDIYADDPKNCSRGGAGGARPSTKRSQFTPRSALQTLLAAARQIACTEQSSVGNTVEASKSSFKGKSIASPSCANSGTITKKGSLIWQGLTSSEATAKELLTNKHIGSTPKASMLVTGAAQGASAHEYSQNVSMHYEAPDQYIQDNVQMNEVDSENIFHVEGTSSVGAAAGHQISLELAQDRHALYLATSPLTPEFTPNLGQPMSFLESCFLCKRPLGQGHDIFMYRGENAFCSVECRDKQMRMEERKEKLKYIHSQINKRNVRKQEILCANTRLGSTNAGTSYYQPHKHHQQYSSQAVA